MGVIMMFNERSNCILPSNEYMNATPMEM